MTTQTGSEKVTFTLSFKSNTSQPRRVTMTIFKCPYCPTEYELIRPRLSFQQRSYANCQVCYRTMFSWSSRNVPRLTLTKGSESQRHIIPTAAIKKRHRAGLYDFIGGGDAARRAAVVTTRDPKATVLRCAGSNTAASISLRET